MFKEPTAEQFGFPTLTINRYGTEKWLLNGKLHRENGPAVETPNGTKLWLLNDTLHKTNGPAVEYADGYKAWYLNGIQYSEQDFVEEVKKYV